MEYPFYACSNRSGSGRRLFPAVPGFLLALELVSVRPVHAAGAPAGTSPLQPPALFDLIEGAPLSKAAAPRFTLRRAPIVLKADLGMLSTVTINLPAGPVVAERTRFVRHSATHFEWFGNLPQDSRSSVLFVFHEGTLVGKIETRGKMFEVRRLAGDAYMLDEVDLAGLKAAIDPRAKDYVESPKNGPALPKRSGQPQSAVPAAATVIDIMVLYDQAVLDRRGDVIAFINTLVAEANEAFSRSRINQVVRLVRVEKVEKGLANATEETLKKAADDADIAALRNRYGADLVSILVKDPNPTGSSGIADIDGAYNLVAVDYAQTLRTFSHEMGHNMGALHNREDAFLPGFFPPPNTYNYGHRDFQKRFITIMAYIGDCTGCTFINNFSNPSVYYDGAPTGVAGASDNARKLRETMASVAAWQKDSHVLTVAKTGQGRVVSDIAAIDCGADCNQAFPKPEIKTVTLTATPEAGWSFKGWTGACQGMGACVLTMGQDRQATALFAPAENFLALSLIDLEKNREVAALSGTNAFRLDTLPRKFTVQAKAMPGLGSIRFELAGPQFRTFTTQETPHTLYGTQAGVVQPWDAAAGRYNLNVTAYAGADGAGDALVIRRMVVELKLPPPVSTALSSKPESGLRRSAGGFEFRQEDAASMDISLRDLRGRETRSLSRGEIE